MSRATRDLMRARAAIVGARPQEALSIVESFVKELEDGRVDSAEHDRIEAMLTELRFLAQSALTGAETAMTQISEIIQAASSLRTYDSAGRRQVASVDPDAPRRF